MISRAEFWQQLLQHGNRIFARFIYPLAARLGAWPGLILLALLLVALTTGFVLFWQAGSAASAQSPAGSPRAQPGVLAQIATRTPTRRATTSAMPTQTATSTGTTTGTATSTATATPSPRPPTPTWTPFPNVTPIANSPLPVAPALVQTATPTHSVPLPANMAGPQVLPVGVITGSITAATISPASGIPATVTAEDVTAEDVTAETGADTIQLLLPTPTPTPTLSINEALEQPVATQEAAAAGLAGLVATATAALPAALVEAESVAETIAEVEGEAPAESEAAHPVPAATVASQPTPDGSTRTARVPILMYHYLSVPPAGADIYRKDLSVSPELFAAHLDVMQQEGYTPITLYALLDYLTYGAPLPEKPVVLTFDDGYRDNYTNAFPLLRERGMTATFFIVTDFIYDQRPEYLTWDMVREMYAAGMSIEGHGRNHVSLANKDSDYLIWQALGTYESIEVEIGVRPRFISYPAGEYDRRTMDILRSANYWAGFTTKQGATHHSDDLFQLRRIRVRGSTTPAELLRVLALDW